MKSIFMSTVKRMPNSKNKTYPKRVRILIYKKCGLLLEFNFLCDKHLCIVYFTCFNFF